MYSYAPLRTFVRALPEQTRLPFLREVALQRPSQNSWHNCFVTVACRVETGLKDLKVGMDMAEAVLGLGRDVIQQTTMCWDHMSPVDRELYFYRILPRQIRLLERSERRRQFAVPEPPVVQIRKDLPVRMPARKIMETIVLVLCVMLVV